MNNTSARLIIGHAGTDEVKIWVRGDQDRRTAILRLARSGQELQQRSVSLPEGLYTGVATFTGLEPSQTYTCLLSWESTTDTASGTFRTAPAEPQTFSFLLGSCNFPSTWLLANQAKAWRILDAIIEREKPAFMIHGGDQIYADPFWHLWRPRPLRHYQETYLKAWSGHARSVLSRLPHYMILDDHEIRNDYAGGEEGDDAHGIAAYKAFQHLRNPHPYGDENGPFYYRFDWGSAHFMVLDTRTERRPDKGEMVSPTQLERVKEWLLLHPPADPKFVVTGVPFLGEPRFAQADKWVGFPAQRNALLRYLVENEVKNVIFLTGDMHHSYFGSMHLSDGQREILLHEIMSSPINQALDYGTGLFYRQGRTEPDRGLLAETRLDLHRARDNIVEVTFDPGEHRLEGRIFHTKGFALKPHAPHAIPLV